MSRRGQCWDNAPTESFFASMKKETGIAKWVLEDAQAVQMGMLDWIENWYNPVCGVLNSGRMQPGPV